MLPPFWRDLRRPYGGDQCCPFGFGHAGIAYFEYPWHFGDVLGENVGWSPTWNPHSIRERLEGDRVVLGGRKSKEPWSFDKVAQLRPGHRRTTRLSLLPLARWYRRPILQSRTHGPVQNMLQHIHIPPCLSRHCTIAALRSGVSIDEAYVDACHLEGGNHRRLACSLRK